MKTAIVALALTAVLYGCGEDSKPKGQNQGGSPIAFERTDLPRVQIESLLGKEGTYVLESARGNYQFTYITHDKPSNANVTVEYNARTSSLDLVSKTISGEPTVFGGYFEPHVSIDAKTSEVKQKVSVSFEIIEGNYSSDVNPMSAKGSLLNDVNQPGVAENVRIYLRSDKGFILVAKASDTSDGETTEITLEATYRFVPAAAPNTPSVPSTPNVNPVPTTPTTPATPTTPNTPPVVNPPRSTPTGPARGETVDSWIQYFQKLRAVDYPYEVAYSGNEATKLALEYYQTGLVLDQFKNVMEFVARLKEPTYPYALVFTTQKAVRLSKAILQSGAPFEQVKTRTEYYRSLRNPNYPYGQTLKTSEALQMAFKELDIQIDVDRT